MRKLIGFFISRPRLNYTLAFLLVVFGLFSYYNTPKELFPPIALDKIVINGGYAGSSADNLDRLAVRKIESEIAGINGVTKIESLIFSGSFTIIATLKEGSDIAEIVAKIKDTISQLKQDLPSDMEEPSVLKLETKIPLIHIAVSGDSKSDEELLQSAKEIKKMVSTIPHLTGIEIYGESDEEIEIRLDSAKIEAYGLSKDSIIRAISDISYIFPLGKIQGKDGFFYINSGYGKQGLEDMENSIISVKNKRVRLKDIADITFRRADTQTKSLFEKQKAFVVSISKDKEGNAIELAKEIKELAKEYETELEGVSINPHGDTSVFIKNRLNTVISNITLGFILVTLSMFVLINWRISIVVALGIPFSFIIGVIFFDITGNSINMISLLGALIAVGVLVDDAIIVAENIQRRLEEGLPPKEAVIEGASEVFLPVLAATVTTIFAFLPMFLISEEIGKFIKMIPLALIILLLASLVESFVFLPMHSKDILKPNTKSLNWEPLNNIYIKTIRLLVHYKKSTVAAFLILVPLLTALGFIYTPFQLFPKFDGTQLFISGKLQEESKIEDSIEIAKKILKDIEPYRKEFFIKDTYTVGGIAVKGSGEFDSGENMFTIFLELEEPREEGFIHNYILPLLSFDFDRSQKIRTKKTFVLEEELVRRFENLAQTYNLQELNIESQKSGIVSRDIDISIVSSDKQKLLTSANMLKEGIKSTKGTKDIGTLGLEEIDELKVEINPYGERLGVTEVSISKTLSSLFLDAKATKSFGDEGVIYIRTKDINKDDPLLLENLKIETPSGSFVSLKDVASITPQKTFQKISKENGDRVVSIYANINTDLTTATQTLKNLEPILEKIKESGVAVKIGGEKEKNEKFIQDMIKASFLALGLMFLTLLLMFDSFKSAFMILSVIPLSFLGVIIGHTIMGMNISMPSIIGILGLSGVVINDGIIMLDFIKRSKNIDEILEKAKLRLRPILLTSLTTVIGLSTLVFFPSGQALALQPLAVSLGFGLLWGTVLNLIYLPALYALLNRVKS